MLAVACVQPEKALSTKPVRLGGYILHQVPSNGGIKMRDKPLPFVLIVLPFAIFSLAGCVLRHDVSGVWKGSIESTDKRGHKWQGPAELTLNQNGDAITGTLVFSPPQAGRVQVPITSGVVSKDSLTFSGQNQFPMASVEIFVPRQRERHYAQWNGGHDFSQHNSRPGNRDGFVESPKAMIGI